MYSFYQIMLTVATSRVYLYVVSVNICKTAPRVMLAGRTSMADPGKSYSYKQAQLAEEWDAIVIGSGIGGLTAAALLAKHGGKRVLVLERHYVAGGFTHSFHRPGYVWDVGVHYIGQVQDPTSPLRAVFDHLTRGRLKWNPMPEVYDLIRIADHEYELVAGLERFRDRLKSYFPNETSAIDRYVRAVQSCRSEEHTSEL